MPVDGAVDFGAVAVGEVVVEAAEAVVVVGWAVGGARAHRLGSAVSGCLHIRTLGRVAEETREDQSIGTSRHMAIRVIRPMRHGLSP